MSENKQEPQISFWQFAPYFSSFIILIAVFRLYVFYIHFGITITDYLQFTEIITSFLNVLNLALLCIGFLVIQVYINRDKEQIEKNNYIFEKILSEKDSVKQFVLYFKENYRLYLLVTIFAITGIIISAIFYNGISSRLLEYIGIAYLFVVFYFFLIFRISSKHRELNTSKERKFIIATIFYSLMIMLACEGEAVFQVNMIKDNKKNYGVTIYFDSGQKLVSDSSNYFIGKTQDYLFFYHQDSSKTDVYPVLHIKKISFPNKFKNL